LKNQIKIVGFDLGGVYLTDCWGEHSRKAIAEKFGFDRLMSAEIEPLLKKVSRQMLLGQINQDQLLKKLIPEIGDKLDKVKNFLLTFNQEQFPETRQIILQVKKKMPVAMMNDEGREWHEYRMKKFKLAELFDHFFTSYDFGHYKIGNPQYFKKVLATLKINPQQLMFIDNRQDCLEPANRLGIRTILFQNPSQLSDELMRHNL